MLLSSRVSQKRRDAQAIAKLEFEDQNEEFTLEDVIEFLVTEGYVWDREGAEKMLEELSETEMELILKHSSKVLKRTRKVTTSLIVTKEW